MNTTQEFLTLLPIEYEGFNGLTRDNTITGAINALMYHLKDTNQCTTLVDAYMQDQGEFRCEITRASRAYLQKWNIANAPPADEDEFDNFIAYKSIEELIENNPTFIQDVWDMAVKATII